MQLIAKERFTIRFDFLLDSRDRIGIRLMPSKINVFEPLDDLVGRNVENAVQVHIELGTWCVVRECRDEPGVEVLAVSATKLAEVRRDTHLVMYDGCVENEIRFVALGKSISLTARPYVFL